MSLEGYALVTGAGSGLGRGIVLAFAKAGALGVVLADVNLDAATEAAALSITVAAHAGYRALPVKVDVTSEAEVDALVAQTVTDFGRIDYAVNSAGIGVRATAPIQSASVPDFQRFMDVNVLGIFLCTRAQSAAMLRQDVRPLGERGSRGVIVNMGSCSSFVATAMMGQYTTSKHAVLGLSRNAALDLAPHSIRVNCVCPSWVDTPTVSGAVAANPSLKKMIDTIIPMGRIAQVDEIADVVLFLCGIGASYVTGSAWIVDGGTTLGIGTA